MPVSNPLPYLLSGCTAPSHSVSLTTSSKAPETSQALGCNLHPSHQSHHCSRACQSLSFHSGTSALKSGLYPLAAALKARAAGRPLSEADGIPNEGPQGSGSCGPAPPSQHLPVQGLLPICRRSQGSCFSWVRLLPVALPGPEHREQLSPRLAALQWGGPVRSSGDRKLPGMAGFVLAQLPHFDPAPPATPGREVPPSFCLAAGVSGA